MRKYKAVLAALIGAAAVMACGDDTVVARLDGSANDGTVAGGDALGPADGGADASVPLDAAEGGPTVPLRLLLSYNGSAQSELVSFGLASKAVDGRLIYGDSLGTAFVGSSAPWLLEQGTDIVARLDAQKPWIVDASWNVALHDSSDAGFSASYSDPQAVIDVGTKAYVLRYTRNLIAVIDPKALLDAGAPTASIDLSGELQSGGDGYVEPVAAVYVAPKHRVYVLLGNINRYDVDPSTFALLCSNTKSTVIAIDTTTDALVDLDDAGPGHGWALDGFNPAFGSGGLVYDAQGGSAGRLLVLDSGCNQPGADGGVGPLVKREVEAVDLATGQATKLLDLTTGAFPSGLTLIDANHAIVQLDTAYTWDPTTATLGPAIPNAPDAFAYDGAGNLLGVKATFDADGGPDGYDVVSVSVATGTSTKLGTNPFSLTSGFLGGVALWPSP